MCPIFHPAQPLFEQKELRDADFSNMEFPLTGYSIYSSQYKLDFIIKHYYLNNYGPIRHVSVDQHIKLDQFNS